MPWQSPHLEFIVEQAKQELKKYYQYSLVTAQIFIVTKKEMRKAVVDEQKLLRVSDEELEDIKFDIIVIQGKFFPLKNEIWLIQQDGEKYETLVHELLHSIQKCNPDREDIVYYLTYKLTKNPAVIPAKKLIEWQEIEKSVGLKSIIKQLLLEKGCEDF